MAPSFSRVALALLLIVSCSNLCTPAAVAEVTEAQRTLLRASFEAVQAAGKAYQAGDFEQAGSQLIVAMQKASEGLRDADAETFEKVESMLVRIERAHALLQLEGVVLPPFARPRFGKAWQDYAAGEEPGRLAPSETSAARRSADQPAGMMADDDPAPERSPRDGRNRPGNDSSAGISFVNQVAPILISKCGRCHIQGQRGQFSLASYAVLMRGPAAGVVVFAGDPVGSRLIEVIETGDMPRGGDKVTADQLSTLKTWVSEGAKFDGPAPAAPLVSYAQPLSADAPSRPRNSGPTPVAMADGNETVSFARQIAPLLVDNCRGCHIDAMQNRGGLNMNTLAQLMRGGDSGEVVEPGSGDASLLVRKLRGQEGNRMPAGGRPALPEEQIALVSKWIDEGAKLDAGNEDQPLGVMVTEVWAENATHEELAARRMTLARDHWKLGAAEEVRGRAVEVENEDVFVIGSASQEQIDAVAEAASEAIERTRGMLPASRQRRDSGKSMIRGRVSLFVFPRRYDYGEFSKMVEGREVPGDWNVHWHFDGVDAYVSLVVDREETADDLMPRLVAPMASIQVAMRGDSPRWFREGVGRAVAAKTVARDLPAVQQWNQAIPQALTVIKKPKDVVEQRLPPAETDLIGYGMAQTLIDRQYRRQFDALLRAIEADAQFDEAFAATYGAPLEAFVTNWLAYYARSQRR